MFTGTPEKPAWLIAAIAIIFGTILVGLHLPVPTVLQGIALAGLVAAVALADAGTSNVFAWGLVALSLIGIGVLALLSDPLPTWLEAVTALGVTGGASLSVPTSVPHVFPVAGTGVTSEAVESAPGAAVTAHRHIVGPS